MGKRTGIVLVSEIRVPVDLRSLHRNIKESFTRDRVTVSRRTVVVIDSIQWKWT